MDVALLREATAQDHADVETTVPLMNPDLDIGRYVAVLSRMHGVVAAWEEYAENAAPPWLQRHLAVRSRRGLLERDLADLGGTPASCRASIPELPSEAALLGAMYVMEGSRLGGRFIARHIEQHLQIESSRGDAFFLGDGDSTGTMWKQFLDILESRIPESASSEAIDGAKTMFRVFGEWMRGSAAVQPRTPAIDINEAINAARD